LLKYILLIAICLNLLANEVKYKPIKYKKDDASNISLAKKNPKSHLKIYLPSIPYSHIMRLINGTLVRLNDSSKGWEYFLAKSHKKIDSLTYDFELRRDVKFQDGSLFNANSVIENFEVFQKGAFTYTDIHNKLKSVEKLDDYRVRIHLNRPYGMLLNDLARINLYTSKYLEKYSWSSSIAAVSTKATGAYGSGPYILESGVATSLELSEKIVLKANPYYFEKGKPYIEKITIFTKLPIPEVIEMISQEEGKLDIAVIPFNKKTEVVNSPFAKLVSVESSFNLSIHFNLMNKKLKLQNQKVRQALNQALDQSRLIKFAYKNEGVKSPFLISANSFYAKELSSKYIRTPKQFFSKEELYKLLDGLTLKVVTQDRFISLWKGIEYQLNEYGVTLKYDVTTDETYILNRLLTNRKNSYDWDLLIWGNDDWYGHPWYSFFNIYTKNQWSSVLEDEVLDRKFEELFEIEIDDAKFKI
jgi:glutathione transport system substrate-binding protein